MYGCKFIQVCFIISKANNSQNFQLLISISSRFPGNMMPLKPSLTIAHPQALQGRICIVTLCCPLWQFGTIFQLWTQCVVLNLVQYLVAQIPWVILFTFNVSVPSHVNKNAINYYIIELLCRFSEIKECLKKCLVPCKYLTKMREWVIMMAMILICCLNFLQYHPLNNLTI